MENLEQFLEFLQKMQGKIDPRKDDFKKEIWLGENIFLPIDHYRSDDSASHSANVFYVYLDKEVGILHYENNLKKDKKFFLVVTTVHWNFSSGEYKPFPGPKKFAECVSQDIRKKDNLIKIKIINYYEELEKIPAL